MQTHITDEGPPLDPRDWDPTSPKMTKLPSQNGIYSPNPRRSGETLDDLQRSEVSYGKLQQTGDANAGGDIEDGLHGGDADSTEQVGMRSEAPKSVLNDAVRAAAIQLLGSQVSLFTGPERCP